MCPLRAVAELRSTGGPCVNVISPSTASVSSARDTLQSGSPTSSSGEDSARRTSGAAQAVPDSPGSRSETAKTAATATAATATTASMCAPRQAAAGMRAPTCRRVIVALMLRDPGGAQTAPARDSRAPGRAGSAGRGDGGIGLTRERVALAHEGVGQLEQRHLVDRRERPLVQRVGCGHQSVDLVIAHRVAPFCVRVPAPAAPTRHLPTVRARPATSRAPGEAACAPSRRAHR